MPKSDTQREKAVTQARVDELRELAVDPSSLRLNGPYTIPPSWGVYRIAPSRPIATRLFRFGNHPIRQTELHDEFGAVSPLAHYTSRALAKELASLLNAGYKF
jgi:hypothetical protein